MSKFSSSEASIDLLRTVAVLWLIGVVIRLPILAIPPILPFIQTDLGMSGTEVGTLSGIPMILLAIAALPGSAAIGFIGAFRALLLGILVTAAGSILRSFTYSTFALFAATAFMSAGIAITQPALPVVVRQWLPQKIGLGTATYSNGMIIGCVIPVAMTLTLVMPALNDSWRQTLIFWSVPIAATPLLLFFITSKLNRSHEEMSAPRSLSGLDYSLIWRIGLIFGANNCVYFGTNAFLPPYLIATDQANLVTEALSAYNLAQLPGSLFVLSLANKMERRRWPYISAGCFIVLNLGWLATSTGFSTIVAATTLGFFSGITLATGLMLPPLLSKPSDVARTAGAMFTVSYTLAMVGSIAGGAAWDLMGHPHFAFAVLGLCALPLILVTPTLNFSRAR